MSVDIPDRAIRDAQSADSDPAIWKLLLALASPESGWNPAAQGDCMLECSPGQAIVDCQTPGAFPTSFGYLQMHQCGGLGTGYSAAQLLDGRFNMQLGASYIRNRLAEGESLYNAISPWSTRPAAWTLYQRILSDGITGVDDGGPPPETGGWLGLVGIVVAGLLIGKVLRGA